MVQLEVEYESRQRTLQELVEYRKSPSEIGGMLLEYEWDFEMELVQLERGHVVAVLQRFLSGEISAEEIEEWANLIEGRDDVGYEDVADAIHVLANPEIMEPLTRELAVELIEKLEHDALP